jgi:16S rRNA (uracil1498-N3)-methyltransferase
LSSLKEWLGTVTTAVPPGQQRWLLSPKAPALWRPPQTTAISAVVFLSGPEGGLSQEEEALAQQHGFIPVGLGPRVLRADTAPLAVLAALALSAA